MEGTKITIISFHCNSTTLQTSMIVLITVHLYVNCVSVTVTTKSSTPKTGGLFTSVQHGKYRC